MKTLWERLQEKLDANSIPVSESGCKIWLGAGGEGYGAFMLDGIRYPTHRAAWSCDNGKDVPPGMCVLHRCDIRPCIEPSHLFIGTKQDNFDDMVAKGRRITPKGERVHTSKFTPEIVQQIRAETGSFRSIGRKYGVGHSAISAIKNGKSWMHVPIGEC